MIDLNQLFYIELRSMMLINIDIAVCHISAWHSCAERDTDIAFLSASICLFELCTICPRVSLNSCMWVEWYGNSVHCRWEF